MSVLIGSKVTFIRISKPLRIEAGLHGRRGT
jgi:hypothetical protein